MLKHKLLSADKGDSEEMLPEYNFTNGTRGMFAGKIPNGGRIIVLDPDVAKVFKSQEAANAALRKLAETFKLIKS